MIPKLTCAAMFAAAPLLTSNPTNSREDAGFTSAYVESIRQNRSEYSKRNPELIRNDAEVTSPDATLKAAAAERWFETKTMVDRNPLLTEAERTAAFDRAMDRARRDVALAPLQGSPAEAGQKIATYGIAGTAAVLGPRRGLLGLAYNATVNGSAAFVDWRFGQLFKTKDEARASDVSRLFTVNERLNRLNYVDLEVMKDPRAQKYRDVLQPGVFDRPALEDPRVRDRLAAENFATETEARGAIARMPDAGDRLSARVSLVNKTGRVGPEDRALIAADLKTAVAEMNAEANAMLAGFLARDERAREHARLRETYVGPVTVAAQIIALGDDVALAQGAQAAAQLYSNVFEMITMTRAEIVASPYTFLNYYVGSVAIVTSLLRQGEQQSENAAIMAALRQIAERLEDLRREMHRQFEALNHKIDYYFVQTQLSLRNIQDAQAVSIRLLNELQTDLGQLKATVNEGLNNEAQRHLTEVMSKCLPKAYESRAGALPDPNNLDYCLRSFVDFGTGRDSRPFKDPTWNAAGFEILKGAVDGNKSKMVGPPTTLQPMQVAAGTALLAEFLKKNPDRAREVASNWREEYNQIKAGATAFKDFTRRMAVEPEGGVRDEVGRALLAELRKTADDMRTAVTDATNAGRKDFPDPADPWAKDTPQFIPGFSALKVKKGFDKPILDFDDRYYNTTIWDGDWAERNARSNAYREDLMRVTDELYRPLGPDVRWPLNLGPKVLDKFRLELAFSYFNVFSLTYHRGFANDPSWVQTNVLWRIDLWANYEVGGQTKRLLVAQLRGKSYSDKGPLWDVRWADSLAGPIWTGDPAPTGIGENKVCGFLTKSKKCGLLNSLDEGDLSGGPVREGLTELQKDLLPYVQSYAPNIRKLAETSTADLIQKFDGTRWALTYWLSQGLRLDDPVVADLYREVQGGGVESGKDLLDAMLSLSAEKGYRQFDQRLAEIERKMIDLKRCRNVRAPDSELEDTLMLLEAYRRIPAPAGWFDKLRR